MTKQFPLKEMYTHALMKDNVDLRHKFRQNVDKLENDISPLLMLEDSSLKAVKLAIEGKVNYEYVTTSRRRSTRPWAGLPPTV